MKHRYLFGLLLGVVCFCFYLFQVIYSGVKEKTIADLNSRQLIHGRQAGRGIEYFFSDLTTFLTKVSESGHVISLDDQGRKELDFALKTNRQQIKAITRVDETGRILYTLPYDGTAIGRDISYQKHIREIMKTRKPVVSDVFTAVQGYTAVALHVPVFKGNEYRGTLAALIDFQAISKKFLEDIRIGETGYAWMTSRDGIELYCPVPGHTGKSVFENCKDFPTIISMAKEMVKGNQGVTTYSFDQIRDLKTETVRKHAVYLPVKIGDNFWTIVVASSEDEILASLESFRSKLIAVMGLLLLGSAVFSFYGMRARGIIREEAKRQNAEDALHESEARYGSLFENNHAVMLLIDPDSAAITDANPAACAYYGWSREELKKRRIDEINTLTSEEVIAEMQLARSERRNHFFFKHRLADGTIRDVEVYSGPLTLKGKIFLYSIVHDITERKLAEKDLKKSEERYRDLVENATELICTHDLKGALLSVNAAAARAWGFAVEEVVGQRIPDMLPQDRRHEFNDYIKAVQRDGTVVGIMKVVTQAGEVRFWEYRNTLRTEGVPEPLVRGIARDVTGEVLAKRALKKSEKRYRLLFERNLAGVFRTSIDGRLINCNDAFARIYGYESREEIMQHTAVDLHVSPKARQDFIAKLQAGGRLLDFEIQGRRKDGSLSWLLENVTLIPGEEAGRNEIEGTIVDITDRKRAEDAVMRERDLTQAIIDSLPGLFYAFDDQERMLRWNKSFEEVTGYSAQEIASMSPLDFFGEPEKKFVAEAIQKVFLTGQSSVEADLLSRDQTMTPYFFTGKLFLFEKKLSLIGMGLNVTERKRAEEALRESEKKYRLVLEANPDPIIVYDNEGKVIYLNPAFTGVFGWSLEERIGKKMDDFVPEENLLETRMMIDMVIAGQNFSGIETRRLTREGKIIPVNISGACYRNQEGKMEASVINLRDITESKRLEAEKEKMEEQYRQAQKMEAIGQLAGGVAHDFNNMLNIILGYSQMALMKIEISSPLHTNIQEIMNAARRSADLVRQLLAFARKQTIAPKTLDLNDAVAGTLNMLRKLIGENIDLLWMPAANLWSVKMDPAQVDQIVANLAVNARDSIPGVGKITIETGKAEFDEAYCAQHADFVPGQYVLLAVSDNGCGMDKETREQIFDPFFTTKEVGKGTGMGLSTVYGIVKQNNGFIDVYSEPGKGTTFRIYLPRLGEDEGPAINEPSAQAKPLTGMETVLLVEDEETLLKMGKMMLEELGYTVLAADSPKGAFQLAEQYAGDIHMVLTDVVMPEMSGRDLMKRLSDLRPGIKCLFMSGYPANVIAHRGILDDGVHFLQKPFFMNDLAAKVREAMEK